MNKFLKQEYSKECLEWLYNYIKKYNQDYIDIDELFKKIISVLSLSVLKIRHNSKINLYDYCIDTTMVNLENLKSVDYVQLNGYEKTKYFTLAHI